MSDSSGEDDVIQVSSKSPRLRRSIESDEELISEKRLTRSAKKRYVKKASPSSQSSDDSDSDSSSNTAVSKRKRRRKPTRKRLNVNESSQLMSRSARGMIRDTYESAKERFLENNDCSDSSMNGFIAEDDEEESEESEEGESSVNEAQSAGEEESVSDECDAQLHSSPAEVSNVMKSTEATDDIKRGSDDEVVSPGKRIKSQNVIHSDDSDEETDRPASKNELSSPEVIKKKKRKKRRRVVIIPDSQDVEDVQEVSEGSDNKVGGANTDNEEGSDDMSDFIASDSDSISGEDDCKPLFYPNIDDEMTSSARMDHEEAFKVVIESMINRARDENFFQSSDFQDSRGIAEAFKKIFSPLDALQHDIKSQKWCKAFVDALEYTKFSSSRCGYQGICEACRNPDRYSSIVASVSGYRYDKRSLKPLAGEDNSDDDEADGAYIAPEAAERFYIGKYCDIRSHLYHDVLHFKRSLLDSCIEKLDENAHKFSGESTEKVVEELIVEDTGWVELQYMFYKSIIKQTQECIRRRGSREAE